LLALYPRCRRAEKEKTMKPGTIDDDSRGRRQFIRASMSGAGLALVGCATASATRSVERESGRGGAHEEAEVTPGEDLMQEHGVLERVLLIYDESARRIEHGEPLDGAGLMSAAGIIRRFVEDYHEKLEEQFLFPRLEAARREVELVTVLRRQHQRGREVTDEIVRLARETGTPALAQLLRDFTRMYRPHAARENTVLFPAFRGIVGGAGYRELGEKFEDQEHERFGEHGFEHAVAEVAQLEAALGIADLARFTP
jgi:hemerythrin-like domain-containing protein